MRQLVNDVAAETLQVENGLPLGIGVSTYPARTVRVLDGDMIVLYLDGLIEAENPGPRGIRSGGTANLLFFCSHHSR